MATFSSIPAWRIPQTEEPDRPWVHKESDTTEQLTHTHTHTHTRRERWKERREDRKGKSKSITNLTTFSSEDYLQTYILGIKDSDLYILCLFCQALLVPQIRASE